MAAGDVVILASMRINGLVFAGGTVVLDGSNPTPVSLASLMGVVLTGVASLQGTAAPGVDPNDITVNVNGTSLDIYAWKITATGDGTEVASTNNSRLVHWFAIGTELQRKGS